MTNHMKLVYNLLKNSNYITSKEIQKKLKFTDNEVRRVIKLLIEEEDKPIISDRNGFKIASDISELIDYRYNLRLRQEGIQRRINAINDILCDF